MKVIVGFLLIIAGVALGLYVGVWLMLIGGIIQFVDAIKVDPVDTSGVAWGVVRVLFASAAGGFAGWALALVGVGVLSAAESKPRRSRLTSKQVEGDFRRHMR